MPAWKTPPPHTPKRCREDVEADVRVLMAKMSQIEPRGFDSIRARNILHNRIDVLLDEWRIRLSLEALDGTALTGVVDVGGL